jgi:hypothetical protein
VWIITLTLVVISSEGIIQGLNKSLGSELKSFLLDNSSIVSKNKDILLKFNSTKEGDMLKDLIKKIPEDKYSLLKELEIKNNELYVILYNNVPCIIGELKDLNKKLEVALEILNTAKRQGIEIAEIDLRTLKLPVIKEVRDEEIY